MTMMDYVAIISQMKMRRDIAQDVATTQCAKGASIFAKICVICVWKKMADNLQKKCYESSLSEKEDSLRGQTQIDY